MAGQIYFATILLMLASFLTFRRVTSLEEYKLGVLLPYTYDDELTMAPPAERYAAAVSLAIEKVNSDPALLSDAKLSFVWNNTGCNQTKMVKDQHWQIEQGVVGFVGPSCHGRKAARVAAKRDLAVISYDCQNPLLANKKLHPNVARTNPQHSRAAFKILELVKAKGWKRVNIVFEDDHKWTVLKKFLLHLLKRNGVKIGSRVKVGFLSVDSAMPDILSSITPRSQATILVTSLGVAREILYQTQLYFEKSPSDAYTEHSFVNVPLDRLSTDSATKYPFKWFFSIFGRMWSPEITNRTQRAFKKLLIVADVSHKRTEKFELFQQELKTKAAQGPWFSEAYQGCLRNVDGSCFMQRADFVVPFQGAYLYDAVIQFAKALHEVREAGQKPTGKNIVNRLKGSHFTGADGLKHQFDQNADVIYDYTFLGLGKDKNNKLSMLPVESANRVFQN